MAEVQLKVFAETVFKLRQCSSDFEIMYSFNICIYLMSECAGTQYNRPETARWKDEVRAAVWRDVLNMQHTPA